MKLANSIALFVLLLTLIGGVLVGVHDLHRNSSDAHLLSQDLDTMLKQASKTIQDTGSSIGNAVDNIADATENMQHDVRDLANGVNASMDAVATNTARNLEIFGETNNDIRRIVRDPRFSKGVFDILDNTNGVMHHAQLTLQTTDATLVTSQGTFNQASTFFATSDPFMSNLGKMSGDAYTVEHKFFFPPKQKMTVAGYLWKGFQIGRDVLLPGGEAAYYFTNAHW
jgi:type IV secretory pathway VirB4 component